MNEDWAVRIDELLMVFVSHPARHASDNKWNLLGERASLRPAVEVLDKFNFKTANQKMGRSMEYGLRYRTRWDGRTYGHRMCRDACNYKHIAHWGGFTTTLEQLFDGLVVTLTR